MEGAGADFAQFLDAVYCDLPVGGLTHSFYRYPARFSPQFARRAIELFTRPGDIVLDPFMGGGTTVVEALSLGRRCIGSDINPLAKFLAQVKTTPLSDHDARMLLTWASRLQRLVNLHSSNSRHRDWEHYQRNLPWWLRKTLEMALNTVRTLPTATVRNFARCSLLKTAQWALDCRVALPTKCEFLIVHKRYLHEMIQGALAFTSRLGEVFDTPPSQVSRNCRLLLQDAALISKDQRISSSWLPPKLVLTSPPYFGIHIRYHRWQVQGRKETPAQYWLAGCKDGNGEAFYTFGDRKKRDLDLYLRFLRDSFTSISSLLDKDSIVVQLVGFPDPRTHIRPYLQVMRDAGLEELDIQECTRQNSRVWRTVPNRKWYVDLNGGLSTNKEVLLIHRKVKRGTREG